MPPDSRLQPALEALERNRELFRARFLSEQPGPTGAHEEAFPRSATLRWLLGGGRPGLLASLVIQALTMKYPAGRVLCDLLLKRWFGKRR